MSKVIPPTVGRKVWYQPGSADLDTSFGARAMQLVTRGQPFDATVLYVHSDRCVNLKITDHLGRDHFRTSATLQQPGDGLADAITSSIGYAMWMPYKVGQAIKAEKVESVAYADGTTATGTAPLPAESPAGAPRTVTQEEVDAEIVSEHYFTAAEAAGLPPVEGVDFIPPRAVSPLDLLTFCVLVLRNGFTVTGQSACADPRKFNAQTGRDWALKDAKGKVWPLLGFRLRDELAAV